MSEPPQPSGMAKAAYNLGPAPSAPTPEVEKIADALAWQLPGILSVNEHIRAKDTIAQALEPLVAALRELDTVARCSLAEQDSGKTIWADFVLRITSAALAGTGEK